MISLVTGASGFIGSHLVDHLLARGDTVLAIQHKPAPARKRLLTIEGDVLNEVPLIDAVRRYAPQEIYHLAAQSLPKASWEQPRLTHEVNIVGVINVLEAVRIAKVASTIVIASSSAIYDQNPAGAPIQEDDPCCPASPYGTSKLAADHLSRLYAERYGLRILRARPFFLIGPRKVGDVSSDWARNIVAIERRTATALAVGDLEIQRDFLHIADGIDALITIAANGKIGGAYNICSGRGTSLSEVLNLLTGMAFTNITVHHDASKMRTADERIKVGDPSLLKALGWRERHGTVAALRETLQYWRECA